MSQGLDASLAKLDAWLLAHRPDVHAILRPGASASDLAALSARLGALGYPGTLPPELAALLSWHDGQEDGYHGDADGFFTALDGGNFLSCRAIAEWYGDLRKNATQDDAPGYFHDGWIPVLSNDYCVTALDGTGSFDKPAGSLVHVDFKGGESRNFIAPSLSAWFSLFVELLHTEAGRVAYGARTKDDESDNRQQTASKVCESLAKQHLPGYPILHTVNDVPDRTRLYVDGPITSVRLEKRVGRDIHRWECEVDDKELIERSIVLHRSGSSATEKFPDHASAIAAADARVKAKQADGYVPFD